MILQEFRDDFKSRLAGLYEPEEVQNLCFLTLEHVLKMNRVEVTLSRKLKLSHNQRYELEVITSRLAQQEPIQYITGVTEFYGMEFQVNPATLIPRPETEELVEWIVEELKVSRDKEGEKSEQIKALDIGTGSGCIAIALAKNVQNLTMEGVDVSLQALETARLNADSNNAQVTFFQQDILEAKTLPSMYNIIVSNPPYVRELEKAAMNKNVLDFEPETALFVADKDPLIFYRKIGQLAHQYLAKNGMLFFEINEYLGEEMVLLLKEIGFGSVTIRKDMFGKDRMILASR